VESLNAGLLGDIRRHYTAPEAHALPAEGNALLPAAALYCEAVGINDPLSNVYITPDGKLQPCLGLWLLLVALTLAPKLAWDTDLGNLVRRGGPALAAAASAASSASAPATAHCAPGLDGGPLVAGFVTLLKQLHPAVTDDLLTHGGQFLRSVVHATTGATVTAAAAGGPKSEAAKDTAKAPPALPPDAFALMLLLQQVARTAHIPDRVLHAAIPAFLLDTLLPEGARAQ
jgi:hypothetical protein